MPKKGHKVSEETRLRMQEGAKNRPSRLIGRYGLTQQDVEGSYAEGKVWCSKCKSFKAKENFDDVPSPTRCKQCSSTIYKIHYEKNKEKLNQQRRDYYINNHEAELERGFHYAISKYGVNEDWYNRILEIQGGGCAICSSTKITEGRSRFAIDHKHGCCAEKKACDGCRRGILCDLCNRALERLDSIPQWAGLAVSYLSKHGSPDSWLR